MIKKTILIAMFCTFMLLSSMIYAEEKDKIDKTNEIYEKVKYSNIKIEFFGTEYNSNENATIWLQLLSNYQPINNASCYALAYYPNKTIFLNNVLMTYLTGSDGVYYYDTITPTTLGVYILTAECDIPANAFYDDFSDYSKLETYGNITISGGKVFLTTTPNIFLYPYGWWHLNETSGTNVIDNSNYNHNGTTVNNPTWISGKLNNSLQFDGSTQYVDLGNNFNFEYNLPFSVEAWIYPSATNSRAIISKADGTAFAVGWNLQLYNGKAYMTMQNNIGGGKIIQVHTNDAISLNLWQHIVMVYNGSGKASGVKIYVNNSNKFLVTDYDTLNNASIVNIRNAMIGVIDGSASKTSYFSGKIDEVVVYNYTLSVGEIAYRYNNYTGTENMGFGLENATTGYIRSIPITLNGTNWLNYSSTYDLKDGNIDFKVLDNSNNVLCSSLGDISSCANTNSPVKLYAELTKPTNTSNSPEIDSWLATWYQTNAEEIRGSSEIHISAGGGGVCTLSDSTLDDIALRVIQYMLALRDKLFGGLI